MPDDHLFIARKGGRRVTERWVSGPKAAKLKTVYELDGCEVEVRDPARLEAIRQELIRNNPPQGPRA